MAYITWTQEQILTQLDSGDHWNGPAILYRFPRHAFDIYAPNGESETFFPLNASQKTMARLAFMTWNDVMAKPISEVEQWSQIELGNSTTATEYAHAYFPTDSSIWFNTDAETLQNPEIGQYGFETFIHEIGHALGLNHMGNYNGEGDWQPSCYEDSTVYSIMSYFGPEHDNGQELVAWANWTIDGVTYAPQTPMLNDIMAIQSIYGANEITRAGNTVYGFDSNVTGDLSALYDFTKNLHPILTLYDSGGVDTLNLNGWDANATIDLNSGMFSSGNGMTNNLCIAYGCIIENVITGIGNDILMGNEADNHLMAGGGDDDLRGGAGIDTLDGGFGHDTALYSLDLTHYNVSYDGFSIKVIDKTASDSDIDTLSNIEDIQFGSQTRSISFSSQVTGAASSIDGLYSNYQVYSLNKFFTVTDTISEHTDITVYDHVDRLLFKDLTAASDLEAGASTGQVYRLYLTVLGRNPQADAVGCGFWIDKLDRKLLTTEEMVSSFLTSQEFTTRFGTTTSSNESFVNQLYLNLLGRDGHPDSGFAFWNAVLDSKGASRSQVVASFMESSENVSNAAQLIGDHATFKMWYDA